MKNINIYSVAILLVCISLQNSEFLIDFLKEVLGAKDTSSLVLKRTYCSNSEEDSEESEQTEKEPKGKENNEKEFNDMRHSHGILFSSGTLKLSRLYSHHDAKLFSRYFDTETPPPEVV